MYIHIILSYYHIYIYIYIILYYIITCYTINEEIDIFRWWSSPRPSPLQRRCSMPRPSRRISEKYMWATYNIWIVLYDCDWIQILSLGYNWINDDWPTLNLGYNWATYNIWITLYDCDWIQILNWGYNWINDDWPILNLGYNWATYNIWIVLYDCDWIQILNLGYNWVNWLTYT